ncbi:hypothetical protein [Candidatus Hodgkinia cicadicola]|uniref:hypothetical protein n=1 Tax=Candidatus Hodgkinia cicadicola TaxID=573658 RepID=UPI0011BA6634
MELRRLKWRVDWDRDWGRNGDYEGRVVLLIGWRLEVGFDGSLEDSMVRRLEGGEVGWRRMGLDGIGLGRSMFNMVGY